MPVSLVLNLLANGKTTEEIIANYPYPETEDIQQSLAYNAWLAREQYSNIIPKQKKMMALESDYCLLGSFKMRDRFTQKIYPSVGSVDREKSTS